MKKTAMVKLVDAKVSEMEARLAELLASNASDNTKRTQKFQRTSAIHTMKVVKALIEQLPADIKLDEQIEKWFTSMVTLTAERKAAVTVEVKEGDNIMQLMEEHKDTKDIYKKMMAAAEKAGLKADFAKGVFVKK